MLYPLGHDPTLTTAKRDELELGEQKSPDVLYPLGHDPTFFTGDAAGALRSVDGDELSLARQ